MAIRAPDGANKGNNKKKGLEDSQSIWIKIFLDKNTKQNLCQQTTLWEMAT